VVSHEILRVKEIEPERRTNVGRKCEKVESVDIIRRLLLPPLSLLFVAPFAPCSGVPEEGSSTPLLKKVKKAQYWIFET